MRVVGKYSLKDGERAIESKYPELLAEIYDVIASVNAGACRKKIPKGNEINTRGRRSKEKFGDIALYDPKCINKAFRQEFESRGWKSPKVNIEMYPQFYEEGYSPPSVKKAYRQMDFVKNRLGVEVQFGKYSFMVYNVAAKMTIFKNLGYIDVGVEIVPVKEMQDYMSSGVSYYEQFVWDLEHRGEADIDIPVLVLGIIPEDLLR